MMPVDVDTHSKFILFQNYTCVYQSSVKTLIRLGQFINANTLIMGKCIILRWTPMCNSIYKDFFQSLRERRNAQRSAACTVLYVDLVIVTGKHLA